MPENKEHLIFAGVKEPDRHQKKFKLIYKGLIFHFRPKMVNRKTLDFRLTFGLGGMAFVLILMLFITGLLLKFTYLPFPDRAYESVIYLKNSVLFGPLIRNIHYWSANILIIVAFLHFLRVFFTSAFHAPRQLNWVIGLCLFLTILLFNFTGYLLPWDQLSFWAVTICTGMMEYIPWAGKWMKEAVRGGPEVGAYTLSVFYAAHTALLPCVLILIMPFHFWRVRKAGGLVIPLFSGDQENNSNTAVPAAPNLFLRELVTALILIAAVLFISIMFSAPLGDKANPGLSPNPTKAPWYFLGFQEVLMHFHPLIAIFLIPLLIIIGLLRVSYNKYPATCEGIWFVSSKGRSLAVVSFITAMIITLVAVLLSEFVFDFTGWMPGLSPVVSNGLIPVSIACAGCIFLFMLLIKKYSPNKNEKIQMVFVFFLTVFMVLTLTGIWFRGEGMKLVWPG